MWPDRTTDTITHFIGLFDLSVDQARLRDIYEEFELRAKTMELDGLEEVSPVIEHSYDLVSSNVAPLSYPFDLELPPVPLPYVPPIDPGKPDAPWQTATVEIPDTATRLPALDTPDAPPPPPPILPQLPHPGSVLNIIDQQIWLRDDDVLGETGFAPRQSDGESDGPTMAAEAEALELVTDSLPDLGVVPHLAEAEAMAEAMLEARTEALSAEAEDAGQAAEASEEASSTVAEAVSYLPETPAAEIKDAAPDVVPEPTATDPQTPTVERAVHYGEDAVGQFVNGTRSDEAPEWTDLLPEYHRTEDASDGSDAGVAPRDLPQEAGVNRDFEDGHSLVTGGNQAVNEASISTAWVDAPVIAAGGTWIELDQIEQVAAVSNKDIGAQLGALQETTVTQIAEISETAAPITRQTEQISGDGAAPKWLFLDRIEGDLIVSHHINQLIQAFDNDVFGATIAASSSAFILGDNTLFNASHVLAVGLNYDQILVKGDFIEINAISQKLSLEDDDRIEGLPEPEPDPVVALPEAVPEPVQDTLPEPLPEPAPVAAVPATPGAAVLGTVDGVPIEPDVLLVETETISERQVTEASAGTTSAPPDPQPAPSPREAASDAPGTSIAEAATAAMAEQMAEELDRAMDEAAEAGVQLEERAQTPTAADIRAEAEHVPEETEPPEQEDEPPEVADPDGSDAYAPLAEVAADEAEAAPQGNMLLNEARIEKTGVDTSVEITETMSEIVAGMHDDMDILREKLLQDPALAGLEYARVLMVEGDLIQSRIVEQTTALTDNDDIRLPDALPEEMELVVGQNALMNMASIDDIGIDSQVMAAEGAYSDLLIHQASLIDEPVPESGDLLSEAVAFLAETELAAEQQLDDLAAEMGQMKDLMQADDLSSAMT
ncbi:hypothetical protein [Salipiger sp. PrR002]|uniref:hypothetical protein n=1 Tax=Salipiger sp. PrR002 TaxID=2706489 RepID=UPI0013BDBFC7|nr:hypothetical protein [Salipiger sp. PrR002]NDW01138.1 hypothetical protein [Salipiger sp. PrR002]NDW57941.1 hypothetical protein [Salipiger sp. PrR004]